MENTGNELPQSTKQQLIHIYLNELGINYKEPFDNIILLLKMKYNFEVSIDDLMLYFEPTLEEFTNDLELQFKNLSM